MVKGRIIGGSLGEGSNRLLTNHGTRPKADWYDSLLRLLLVGVGIHNSLVQDLNFGSGEEIRTTIESCTYERCADHMVANSSILELGEGCIRE